MTNHVISIIFIRYCVYYMKNHVSEKIRDERITYIIYMYTYFHDITHVTCSLLLLFVDLDTGTYIYMYMI